MEIEMEIIESFPNILEEPIVSEEFIMNNQEIMMINGDVDYFKIVPSYMLCIARNKDVELVDTYTIHALSEYGRAKNKENEYLNFKFKCNKKQIDTVIKFLKWCDSNIYALNQDQIQRAIKQWSKENG